MKQQYGPYAATIGFFDGVHQGHRFVISQLQQVASARGLATMVITFGCQPRQVLQPACRPQLLTTTSEKQALLQEMGVDRVEVLDFTPAMAQLSAEAFMRVLREQLGVCLLVMGYDNGFGHRREGTLDDYTAWGRQVGIEVVRMGPWAGDGMTPSSSRIRQMVIDGQMDEAAALLGRPYALSGLVVHGQRIGREIGFPTANVQPDSSEKLIPRSGVYVVTAQVDDDKKVIGGMMNIGTRPTFDGHCVTLEAHLFHFSGDIYGHRLTVHFVARLRDEKPFPDVTSLVDQMNRDRQQAEVILGRSGHVVLP